MKKYLPLLILSPLVLVLDQVSKLWILKNIARGDEIPVIPGFFELVHVRNPGAAFGVMAGWNSDYRHWFFYGIGLIALVVLLSLYAKSRAGERRIHVPLALILGGAVGNIVDRILYGNVVDFVHWHWKDEIADFSLLGKHFHFALSWPSFNVADAAISCGAIYLALVFLFGKDKESYFQ